MTKNLSSKCPVCDAQIKLSDDVEESEIVTCQDCQSRIVVSEIKKEKITLEKAPDIEEDWGE